jgi:sugar phosphate isomerase/epimerase
LCPRRFPEHPMSLSQPPRPIALQLWTVRHAIEADVDRALARVKAAGFSAVELAPPPPGVTYDRLAGALAAHGLSVVSIHGELPTTGNVAHWARAAGAFHCSKAVWHGWPRDPRFDSLAGVRDLVAACNEAGAIARDHGLKFGLHNHWWEFEPVEGERPIRLLHEGLHPDIFWQLDVYWAQTAGADPAGALSVLSPRVRSVHWKDGPCVHGRPMTALGKGRIDVPQLVRALARPIDWVIELDECATDPLDAAREGLAYLDSIAGRDGRGHP